MTTRKQRGGWSNPASASNGKAGGRPPETVKLRVGQMVSVQIPPAPAEPGFITKITTTTFEVTVDGTVIIIGLE